MGIGTSKFEGYCERLRQRIEAIREAEAELQREQRREAFKLGVRAAADLACRLRWYDRLIAFLVGALVALAGAAAMEEWARRTGGAPLGAAEAYCWGFLLAALTCWLASVLKKRGI